VEEAEERTSPQRAAETPHAKTACGAPEEWPSGNPDRVETASSISLRRNKSIPQGLKPLFVLGSLMSEPNAPTPVALFMRWLLEYEACTNTSTSTGIVMTTRTDVSMDMGTIMRTRK